MHHTINQHSLEDGTHAIPVQASNEPEPKETKCVNQALNESIECATN